jgi:hypothetical protein
MLGIDPVNNAGYLLDLVPTSVTVSVPGAVPEPSTWAMMLLGFAGLGFAAHRGRRRAGLKFIGGTTSIGLRREVATKAYN